MIGCQMLNNYLTGCLYVFQGADVQNFIWGGGGGGVKGGGVSPSLQPLLKCSAIPRNKTRKV